MFIRLRHRRNLKGVATASASYDVVETVRVDGKPRHRFLLGLGSLKQPHDEHDLMRFWLHAIARMNRSNLDNKQCRNLMHGLVRKGVPTNGRRADPIRRPQARVPASPHHPPRPRTALTGTDEFFQPYRPHARIRLKWEAVSLRVTFVHNRESLHSATRLRGFHVCCRGRSRRTGVCWERCGLPGGNGFDYDFHSGQCAFDFTLHPPNLGLKECLQLLKFGR